jgi:hypothetical protein
MRCLTCGLNLPDSIDSLDTKGYPPALRVCPRCGEFLEPRSGKHPATAVGSPGLPHFTLPTLEAAHAPPARRVYRGRTYGRPKLTSMRLPPYPSTALPPSRRAPLVIGTLSLMVVLALLLGAGLLLRGGFTINRAHTSVGSTAVGSTPTGQSHTGGTPGTATAFPGKTLYQSSLKGAAGGWVNDSHCLSKSDGYHITGAYLCYAPVTQQTNVDISVTAKQLSGPASLLYGIVFRASGQGNYYLFAIDANGKWTFAKLHNNTTSYLIQPTASAAIKGTLNQTNVLEIRAVGSHFSLFVNGIQVGQASDSAYSAGLIGLTSEGGVEIVYANIRIAKL